MVLGKISVVVYTSEAYTTAEFKSIADIDLNCLCFIGTNFGVVEQSVELDRKIHH